MILFNQSPEMLLLVFASHFVFVYNEKFLPSSCPSLIYLTLSSPSLLPASPCSADEPGQLKIYLPKKLLECLPKCSSLPKERHRWNTNEVRMRNTRGKYHWQWDELSVFAGDSSLANVTSRDEEEVNKHSDSFSLWNPKTMALG